MYKVKRYNHSQDFLYECSSFLKKEESFNNLIFGIAENTVPDKSENNQLFLSIIDEHKTQIELAAVKVFPHRLVFYTTSTDLGLLSALSNFLKKNSVMLPGVIAPNNLAVSFSEIWAVLNKLNYRIANKERIFELKSRPKAAQTDGFLRKAKMTDIDKISCWVKDFFKEALKEDKSITECNELVETKIGDNLMFLWEDKEVVSMAAGTRPTKEGISITFVYTPKEFRKSGYASSCVASLSNQLFTDRYKCITLFTDLSNPTSNLIYQDIGFTKVGDVYAIDFINKLSI
jgi:uncharacterized protein